METLLAFVPTLITIILVIAALSLLHWLLIAKRPELGSENKFSRQLMMLGFTLTGILTIIMVLPIAEGSRNQLLSLVGLVVSGMIAFSSTSIMANLMGGILLRITKPFRTGDFIQVDEFFGRVSERGLFDTEIQIESRELIAIPNSLIINKPVKTIQSTGSIVSATVSLGYDVHHHKVETSLIEAAQNCELEAPFVHVVELGNFSVVYRISGLLIDTKRILSTRAQLNLAILDTLHKNDIEIMSPSFVNQRKLADDFSTIPDRIRHRKVSQQAQVEELAFDKAESAEQHERAMEELITKIEALEAKVGTVSADEKEKIKGRIEKLNQKLASIEKPTEQ